MLNSLLFRKHVFEDLQPYICTFPHCPKENELYGSQREWFDHEVQLHRREWYCDVCSESFSEKAPFQEHIREKHSELGMGGNFEAVINRCERAVVSGIVCPLCGIDLTFQTLEKHLGLHLQEIALFALPRTVPDEGSIGGKSMKVGFSDECSSEYSSRGSSDPESDGNKPEGNQPVLSPVAIGGIRCICSYQHDDGFLITCNQCSELQHGVCMGIDQSNVPEVYMCSACIPGAYNLEIEKAINIQETFFKSISQEAPATDVRIGHLWARSLELVVPKLTDNNVVYLRTLNSQSLKDNIELVVQALKTLQERDKEKRWRYTRWRREVIVVECLGEISTFVEIYSKLMKAANLELSVIVWDAIWCILRVRISCIVLAY